MKDTETYTQLHNEISKLLGEPAPADVVRGVIEDPLYAHHLRVCRNEPALLQRLVRRPPVVQRSAEPVADRSTLDLAARATAALWEWRKAGFQKVSDADHQRRWNVCLGCPNLVAPRSWLNNVVRVLPGYSDGRVCGLCGCDAWRKAWLPTESCPAPHPDDKRLTRWGEARDLRP